MKSLHFIQIDKENLEHIELIESLMIPYFKEHTFLSRCVSVYNRQVLILKDNEFIRADCHPKLKDEILVGDLLSVKSKVTKLI